MIVANELCIVRFVDQVPICLFLLRSHGGTAKVIKNINDKLDSTYFSIMS